MGSKANIYDSGVSRVRIVPAPDQGDAGVSITAAELHPQWLVLNYIVQVPEDELARGLVDGNPKRFEVRDDLGTEYEVIGGIGSGEGDVRRETVKLAPAVPKDAKRLVVDLSTGPVVLAL